MLSEPTPPKQRQLRRPEAKHLAVGKDSGRGNIFLLVDMNAFFASIEQQCNPFLQGKPVLVCGDPKMRTVVAAASYEARPYGVESGMPLQRALQLCPHAVLVEGNPAKYVDTAKRLHRIFLEFTPQMEVFSIDEVFLQLPPSADPLEIAGAIKRRIREQEGLTCSIGIAGNKMLAKLAASLQKPDGLVWIKPEQAEEVLKDLPVEKMPGIGEKTAARLEALGVRTLGELARCPEERLFQVFGDCMSQFLHQAGVGRDGTPISAFYQEPIIKSMGHNYTLPSDTYDLTLIKSHLHRLSEMVGRRIREENFTGRTVRLTITFGGKTYQSLHSITRHLTVDESLFDGLDIYRVALRILGRVGLNGKPVRMLGVSLASLRKGIYKPCLWEDFEKKWRLVAAKDAVNNKFGEWSLMTADVLAVVRGPSRRKSDLPIRAAVRNMKGPAPKTLLGRRFSPS